MAASLKKQALTLTVANTFTRALGFALRLISARLMGAEAMGVSELAGSAVMLAITPVTAGVPTAMSRLTAQRENAPQNVLRAGLNLVIRLSLWLMPALALLSPALAWLLGDLRTLPSILLSAPSILLLGLCAVDSGWFDGQSDALTPARSECAEQTVRFVLAVALLLTLTGRSAAVTAALPVAAEVAAGIVVLLIFRHTAPHVSWRGADQALRRELTGLAAPTVASRLCQTALRALNAVLLPVCLRRSGLSQAAATAQFGMLGGMAMPLMMLPGIVTSAICMVATPAASRQEKDRTRLRATMRTLLLSGAGVGAGAAVVLFVAADFIGQRLYNVAALAPVLRLMCPAALLFAVQQVQFGLITGLGLQRRALTATIVSSALSLALTAALCPLPRLRLYGAVLATLASALVRVIWNAALLHQAAHGTDGAIPASLCGEEGC